MTHEIDTAMEYCSKANRRWRNECCILIFIIPSKSNHNIKIYHKANKEWKKDVNESRRCNIVYQNLDQYDMVYGPMCANVESVVNNHEDANVILEIMQHSNISTRKTMFSNKDMRYFVANTSSQSNSHFPSS